MKNIGLLEAARQEVRFEGTYGRNQNAGSNDLLVLRDEDYRVIEVSILDFTDFSLHDVTASYVKQGKYLYMLDPAWQDSVMTEKSVDLLHYSYFAQNSGMDSKNVGVPAESPWVFMLLSD